MEVLLVLLKFLTRLLEPSSPFRITGAEGLNLRLLLGGGKIPAQKEHLQRLCDEGKRTNSINQEEVI